MGFDEKPDDESFDAVIQAYAAACLHYNQSGMREGYIKLRAMCSPAPQAAPAEPQDAQALRKALELSVQAMRAPFDGGKGELERKALDAARAALGSGK